MFYLNKERFDAVKRKRAVILCDRHNIMDELSYEQVQHISDSITSWISRNISERGICIGLRMNHNIYIPSIINSFRYLNIPFIFLNKALEGFITNSSILKIRWVVSLQASSYHDKLPVRNGFLYLQKMQEESSLCKSDIFYVICTSGSTGTRKVVQVTHKCIESNIKALSTCFKVTENDRIYLGSPLTFDPSMVEILLALYNGCCLCLTTPETKANRSYLYESFFVSGVTVLQIVPSLFLLWSEEQIRNILQNSQLRILAFGGEQFPQQIQILPISHKLNIFNLYGITEVSCWASICEISPESDVSLGLELEDTFVEVRDENGKKITEGEGEIFIGSATRICFVDDKNLLERPVYRETGDIGRISKKGIFYIGRKHNVTKRFGHKVQLSRVEQEIFTQTGLLSKCVWYEAESKLLTFIKSQYDPKQNDKIIDKIRVKLLHSLEPQMFPDYFEIIPNFPTTSHGKIDGNFLQNLYLDRQNKLEPKPQDHFKNLVCKYFGFSLSKWEEFLDLKFFEIGGNSILAIQLLSEFGEHPSDLVEALFGKDLRACLNSLKNYVPTQKPMEINTDYEKSSKIPKMSTHRVKLQTEWIYNMKACVDASPLVFTNAKGQTLVAVGSFSHIFAIIDANSGEEISTFILPDSIEGKAGLSACKNVLYVPCFDGNVYALDYQSSTILWKYTTENKVKSTPVLCRKNTAIVLGSYDKYLHCIDINSGTKIWKCFLGESIVASPLVNGDKIFVVTINGSCVYINETGDIIWEKKQSNDPIFGTPCMFNDLFIIGNVNGLIFALSQSGEKMWQYKCDNFLYSSLLTFENCIIFPCHDCNLYIMNGESGKIVETVDLGDKVSSSCCREKNLVFVSCNSGKLLAINLKLGSIVGEFHLPGAVFSSPCFENGRICVGCRDNNLYCIRLATKQQ